MLDASLDVTVADTVSFQFTVTNADDEPADVTFRDGGRADFAVYTDDGEEVWRWSDGRAFAQMLQPATLAPGEQAIFEEEWPDPSPGDYTAEATLRIVEASVSARTPFSV